MAIKKNRIYLIEEEDPIFNANYNFSEINQSSRTLVENGIYYSFLENISVESSRLRVHDLLSFDDFRSTPPVSNLVVDFNIIAPVVIHNQKPNNSDYNSLTYDIKPVYNYYSPQYEEQIMETGMEYIPNIYKSIGKIKSKAQFMNVQKDLITLSDTRVGDVVYPMGYDFSNINSTKKLYPYGVDIKAGVQNSNNKLKKFLRKTKFYDSFLRFYIDASSRNVSYLNDYYLSGVDNNTTSVSLRTVDMLQLDSFFASNQVGKASESFEGLGLKIALLKSFFRNLIKDETKSFKEMLTEKKSYSETLFYRLEKSLGDNFNSPIQVTYIPAESDIIKYYDTQIRHGVEYSYRLVACVLVLGNRYSYSDNFNYSQTASKIDFSVENSPTIQIIETPILQESVLCVAPPPTRPQVDLYTKNNSDSRVYMRLFPYNTEAFREPYIEIEDEDSVSANLVKKSNKYEDKNKIEFNNKNNKIITYEIFKTKIPPSSLRDFSDKKIASLNNNLISNSFIYNTMLKTNEKCYYMFRAINQHGMKSNPSIVYEVELLRGSDTSRLLVEKYHFPKPPKGFDKRVMAQLLQIIPASHHTTVPDEIEQYRNSYKGKLDDIVLGTADYPIWGRKFKIRVTSRNTGRKIDFNVLFDLIKKKTKEEMK